MPCKRSKLKCPVTQEGILGRNGIMKLPEYKYYLNAYEIDAIVQGVTESLAEGSGHNVENTNI